jgi:hypothetical protein
MSWEWAFAARARTVLPRNVETAAIVGTLMARYTHGMGNRLGTWVCGALLLLACCAITDCDPNGCSALDSADECNAGSLRCADSSHVQGCDATPCSATWAAPEKCDAAKPFCVRVKTNTSYPNAAECASAPSCSATRACTDYGLCADAADGSCAATAAGCKASCGNTSSCGFNGTSCVYEPDAGTTGAAGAAG